MDFAVFGPCGDRITRTLEFQGEMGSELAKRHLMVPATYETWLQCLPAFQAAIIMLGIASPGSPDRYAEGTRRLYATNVKLTVVMMADERLRCEQWGSLAERYRQEPPPGYDHSSQWDRILKGSSYGLPTPPCGVAVLRGGGLPHIPCAEPGGSDRKF